MKKKNPETKKKVKPTMVPRIEIVHQKNGTFHIRPIAKNGKIWNHPYNSRQAAHKSADHWMFSFYRMAEEKAINGIEFIVDVDHLGYIIDRKTSIPLKTVPSTAKKSKGITTTETRIDRTLRKRNVPGYGH